MNVSHGNEIILHDAQRICAAVDFESLRDAEVLITGASGLVGTYMLACLFHLRKTGFRMRVHAQHLSDLPAHTAELIAGGGFSAIQADLSRPAEYERLPATDVVVHSAGYAQPSVFTANPIRTIQVNTSATTALLEKLRPHGKFLFISSTEVYTGISTGTLRENNVGTTTPSHPRACYIESKRCGEAICNAFRARGISAASARLGLAYGPGTRKHDKRAMNSFIEQALCGHKIELRDLGVATRTYCYIADAVEVLWQVLLRGKEAVYNVGGHSTLTIADLAELIGKMTGTEVAFPAHPEEAQGPAGTATLDLTRCEAEFGKTQYVSLEEGLRTVIDWQRTLYPTGSGERHP